MLPSPATQLSISSLLLLCWILTCQNILGSVVTTVSPLTPMWDDVCVCMCVCLSVGMCMWHAIKDRCQTLTEIAWRGGERASLGQVAWGGRRKRVRDSSTVAHV